MFWLRTSEMFPRVTSAAAWISGNDWSAAVLAGLCGTQSGWVPSRPVTLGSLCVPPWKQKRLLGRKIRPFSENSTGVRPDTRMGTALGFLLHPSAVACCGLCSFI